MCNNNSSGGESQPSSGAVGEKTSVESTPQNSTPQASEPAMGVIYRITCLVNGKFYVGKTKQKLEKRMAQHRYDSKKGSIGLGAAIRKYGWENFTVEIIELSRLAPSKNSVSARFFSLPNSIANRRMATT